MAGIGQDLKKIYSDETRIVENASLCTGLLLLHPKIGVLLLEFLLHFQLSLFQNLVKQQIVLAIRCSMYSALPAAPFAHFSTG